uniref:Uncharacterized protein AlNc14C7G921 n=1 Tax=Albugo laibachii Nc14 TaxID=890382 RepID=F0W1F2_9STRA|nr:conserved hypothetical protein [Albugo laibachii Nc14]|eukprot:CCA14881.1 conserved hypothetical protein [Albugo laibachii Nc14]
MGRRGVGRRLNDQQRMEILDIMSREHKVKNVDLAKQYGVSEGAIRKLKQMKDRIRDRYTLGNVQNRDKRKRGTFVRSAPFEQEFFEWICRMRESQPYQVVPLTQSAVRQQAIVLARNYEGMDNFKASAGWFARFCSRHRLDPPSIASAPETMHVLGIPPSSTTACVDFSSNELLAQQGDKTHDTLMVIHEDSALHGVCSSGSRIFIDQRTDKSTLNQLHATNRIIENSCSPTRIDSEPQNARTCKNDFSEVNPMELTDKNVKLDDNCITSSAAEHSFLVMTPENKTTGSADDVDYAAIPTRGATSSLFMESTTSTIAGLETIPPAIEIATATISKISDASIRMKKETNVSEASPPTRARNEKATWNDEEIFGLGL